MPTSRCSLPWLMNLEMAVVDVCSSEKIWAVYLVSHHQYFGNAVCDLAVPDRCFVVSLRCINNHECEQGWSRHWCWAWHVSRERESMHYDIGFQLVYSLWATTLSFLMHAREDNSIVHCPQIFKQAFKIIQRWHTPTNASQLADASILTGLTNNKPWSKSAVFSSVGRFLNSK